MLYFLSKLSIICLHLMITLFSTVSEMDSCFWSSLSHENGHCYIWVIIDFILLSWFSFIPFYLIYAYFKSQAQISYSATKSFFNHFAFEAHLWTSYNFYFHPYLLLNYVWFSSLYVDSELLAPWKQGTILYCFGFPLSAIVLMS